MGIVVRQSFISSIFSYLGVVIGAFNTLWLFPKFLDASEIGLFRLVITMGLTLAPFAQIGLAQTTLRFYPQFKDHPEHQRSFNGFLAITALCSFLLFTLFFYLLKNPIIDFFQTNANEINDFLGLILALTFVLSVTGILESLSRSLLKIIWVNVLKEFVLRIGLSLIVVFYTIDLLSFYAMLYSIFAVYSLTFLLLLIYLYRLGAIGTTIKIGGLNRKKLSELLSYASFTLLASSGALIVLQIDSIMISGMLGLSENGIYTTVFFMAVVIEMPRRAITQIVAPMVSTAFGEKNLIKIDQLYKQVSINQFIIGLLLYLGVVLNLKDIFLLIPNHEIYEAGTWVVVIIGLGKLLDMCAGINGEIITLSKHYKFNMVTVLVLAIATILGNWLLIPIWGLNGAAMASALSLVIFNLVKYVYVYHRFNLQPFSLQTAKVLGIGLIVTAIIRFTPFPFHFIVNLLLRSALITVLFVLLVWLLKPSDEIEGLFRKLFAWRK